MTILTYYSNTLNVLRKMEPEMSFILLFSARGLTVENERIIQVSVFYMYKYGYKCTFSHTLTHTHTYMHTCTHKPYILQETFSFGSGKGITHDLMPFLEQEKYVWISLLT